MLSGAGVVTYAVADQSSAPAETAEKPRDPSIHTLKLENRGSGRRGLDRQTTEQFSAVLVTWDNPEAEAKGTPEVRTRDLETGKWSGWKELEQEPNQADGAEGERAATRGGTASLWTGDADGVEVRVVKDDGTQAGGQPTGMDVKLLDPGTDPEGAPDVADMDPVAFAADTTAPVTPAPTGTQPQDTEPPSSAPATETATDTAAATPSGTPSGTATESASPSPTPTVPEPRPSTVVKPPVITQAEWGASTDYDGTPSYGTEIKAAVIHHTGVDSDNGVSCADSRARMRSIQQEHFARGYYDIGYNFVVDRCGTIYEGRAGGTDQPVTGAHTQGFNHRSTGIAALGTFTEGVPVPEEMLRSIAELSAWKLGTSGTDPRGEVRLVSSNGGSRYAAGTTATLHAIAGHSDGYMTSCPGAALKARLPDIRTLAARIQGRETAQQATRKDTRDDLQPALKQNVTQNEEQTP